MIEQCIDRVQRQAVALLRPVQRQGGDAAAVFTQNEITAFRHYYLSPDHRAGLICWMATQECSYTKYMDTISRWIRCRSLTRNTWNKGEPNRTQDVHPKLLERKTRVRLQGRSCGGQFFEPAHEQWPAEGLPGSLQLQGLGQWKPICHHLVVL